jgi:L-fuculose-phosphate aldolase
VIAEAAIRADIVEVGRRLYAKGLVAGNEGNVSVRSGDRLFVTPGGACKGFLRPEDVVETDLEGQPVKGARATSEILMHAAVYRRRSDVVTLGPVPVVPFGTPSTSDLADRVALAIVSAHALLLANHGGLTVGETIWRAWERMETLEQFARIALVARLLGGHTELATEAVRHLEALRVPAGYPPPPDTPRRG